MIDKKRCKAFKYNKQQCTRDAKGNSKYCWQHRCSRFGDAHWYNNTKIQVGIGLAGVMATIILGIYPIVFDPSRSLVTENHSQTQEKLDELLKRLDPGIPEETRRAVENIFMAILKKKDIPQWQWPEKLQEVAKRHQDLLDKWQLVQSGDSAVDDLRDKAHRMIEIGGYDKAHQLLQEAIEINRKAIQSQQETLDKRKLSTAQLLADQAVIAETRLDYKKAIALYKEALDALPRNEQKTQALYMNNLGFLYHTIADYKEAEPLYERALAIDEASLGPEHPDVARDLNNLAVLYQNTNRLKEAEPLMKRAVDIMENPSGQPLPNYSNALGNLATLYQSSNRLKEAEPLMQRALAIDEASLDSEHPNVAIALNNLAALYMASNRPKEAEPLMERQLVIFLQFTRRTGYPHPHLPAAIKNYTALLIQMGRTRNDVNDRLKRLAPEMFDKL